jgi:flagellar biosynthesis protein FlhF
MNIKRFVGKNSRDALSMVKRALGENAIILSNRAVHGGNEIMAFREEDMEEMVSNSQSGFPMYDPKYDQAALDTSAYDASLIEAEVNKAYRQANPAMVRSPRQDEQLMTAENTDDIESIPSNILPVPEKRVIQHHESRLSSLTAMFTKRKPAATVEAVPTLSDIEEDILMNALPTKRSAQTRTAPRSLPAEEVIAKNTLNQGWQIEEPRMTERANTSVNLSNSAKAAASAAAPKVASAMQNASTNHIQATAAAAKPVVAKPNAQKPAQQKAEPQKAAAQKPEQAETNLQIQTMLGEIRTMRDMIASQLTEISWNNIQQRDPEKSRLLSSLLSAGFSASLARQLAEHSPKTDNHAEALKWVQGILAKNILTVQNEEEVLDQGGVFALIGPTGVGKTTTTAKLAARYVMKHGTANLGLITTDAYRIGGHEQLRIYGKILGVMVHAVKDEADLKIALNELKNKHTILIDTVGVSQRDRMVAEQISMLTNANQNIKKLICLNATSTGETLTDVINAYKGRGLDGCIVTKLDEAATIGNTLDVVIREKLKLFYVANGQRVPEDIHLANKDYLIRQAIKLGESKNEPFKFREAELPFIMGTTNNVKNPLVMETNHG